MQVLMLVLAMCNAVAFVVAASVDGVALAIVVLLLWTAAFVSAAPPWERGR